MSNRPARQLALDTEALDHIQSILSGTEWHAEHLEWVAEAVTATGRTIEPPRPPGYCDCGHHADDHDGSIVGACMVAEGCDCQTLSTIE